LYLLALPTARPYTGLGLDTGTLVIVDRRWNAAPVDKRTLFTSAYTATGRAIPARIGV